MDRNSKKLVNVINSTKRKESKKINLEKDSESKKLKRNSSQASNLDISNEDQVFKVKFL